MHPRTFTFSLNHRTQNFTLYSRWDLLCPLTFDSVSFPTGCSLEDDDECSIDCSLDLLFISVSKVSSSSPVHLLSCLSTSLSRSWGRWSSSIDIILWRCDVLGIPPVTPASGSSERTPFSPAEFLLFELMKISSSSNEWLDRERSISQKYNGPAILFWI